jgi:hypothetical protein
MKACYVAVNIYRNSSHPALKASTYRLIYHIILFLGGSDIRAHGYSITDSRIHIGLKQENSFILLNYTKTLALLKVVNAVSRYIEA